MGKITINVHIEHAYFGATQSEDGFLEQLIAEAELIKAKASQGTDVNTVNPTPPVSALRHAIIEALQGEQFKWRTVKGIAEELDEDTVDVTLEMSAMYREGMLDTRIDSVSVYYALKAQEVAPVESDDMGEHSYLTAVRQGVIRVLKDERFTGRTIEAIMNEAGYDEDDVDAVVGRMLDEGTVVTTVGTRSGTVYFRLAHPERFNPDGPTAALAPEEFNRKLVAFLKSDPRYTRRSEAAIRRHFSQLDADLFDTLMEVAEEGDGHNDVEPVVRRSIHGYYSVLES